MRFGLFDLGRPSGSSGSLRMATVTISAPEASIASRISSIVRYLPVPTMRRERNSRPAIVSGSSIIILLSVGVPSSDSIVALSAPLSAYRYRRGIGSPWLQQPLRARPVGDEAENQGWHCPADVRRPRGRPRDEICVLEEPWGLCCERIDHEPGHPNGYGQQAHALCIPVLAGPAV